MSDADLVIELTEKYEHAKDRISSTIVLVEGLKVQTCSHCDGYGNIPRGDACERCDGRGEVVGMSVATRDAIQNALRGDAPRRPCFMTYQRNGRGDYRTCGREYGHAGDHGDATGKDAP